MRRAKSPARTPDVPVATRVIKRPMAHAVSLWAERTVMWMLQKFAYVMLFIVGVVLAFLIVLMVVMMVWAAGMFAHAAANWTGEYDLSTQLIAAIALPIYLWLMTMGLLCGVWFAADVLATL